MQFFSSSSILSVKSSADDINGKTMQQDKAEVGRLGNLLSQIGLSLDEYLKIRSARRATKRG